MNYITLFSYPQTGEVGRFVKDVMQKKVIRFKPDDTLKDVVAKFSEKGISGAPVVDEEKRVIGIITEADIFYTLKEEPRDFRMVHMFPDAKMIGLSFEEIPSDKKTEEVLVELGGIKVSEMMKKGVKTVGPEDKIKVVIDIVASGLINRVPVVEGGKLVGIVSRGDIIKGMSELVE
jgi:CBS domain-containing protein